MVDNTEADVRLLVRQVAERARLGGGMDRQTYDVLPDASAALAGFPFVVESGQDALEAIRSRLRACGPAPVVKAA